MFIKINLKGIWYDIELTKKEIEKIKNKVLDENIEIIKKVLEKVQESELEKLCESQSIFNTALSNILSTMTQHWVYRMEDYAKKKIIKEKNSESEK